jgi:hypothetical protein
MRHEENAAIIAAYTARGTDACSGKGGFHIRGRGFVSLAQARKETGVNMAAKREPRMVQGAWGDYATIAMMNGVR